MFKRAAGSLLLKALVSFRASRNELATLNNSVPSSGSRFFTLKRSRNRNRNRNCNRSRDRNRNRNRNRSRNRCLIERNRVNEINLTRPMLRSKSPDTG